MVSVFQARQGCFDGGLVPASDLVERFRQAQVFDDYMAGVLSYSETVELLDAAETRDFLDLGLEERRRASIEPAFQGQMGLEGGERGRVVSGYPESRIP